MGLGIYPELSLAQAVHRNVLWCRPRKVIGADGNGHPEPCGNAVLLGPGMYLEHYST